MAASAARAWLRLRGDLLAAQRYTQPYPRGKLIGIQWWAVTCPPQAAAATSQEALWIPADAAQPPRVWGTTLVRAGAGRGFATDPVATFAKRLNAACLPNGAACVLCETQPNGTSNLDVGDGWLQVVFPGGTCGAGIPIEAITAYAYAPIPGGALVQTPLGPFTFLEDWDALPATLRSQSEVAKQYPTSTLHGLLGCPSGNGYAITVDSWIGGNPPNAIYWVRVTLRGGLFGRC